jgi:hypothetical protein
VRWQRDIEHILGEGTVDQGEGDAEAPQLRRQNLMPIQVNLQGEGTPGGALAHNPSPTLRR